MRVANLAFLAAAAVLLASATSAPYLRSRGYVGLSELNYKFFEQSCHQRSDRSLYIFGHKMGVCARCFGVYLGLVVGGVLYPLISTSGVKPPKQAILYALTPLALDGLTQFLGYRISTNPLRVSTGVVFGSVLPFYLIAALDRILQQARIAYKRTRR